MVWTGASGRTVRFGRVGGIEGWRREQQSQACRQGAGQQHSPTLRGGLPCSRRRSIARKAQEGRRRALAAWQGPASAPCRALPVALASVQIPCRPILAAYLPLITVILPELMVCQPVLRVWPNRFGHPPTPNHPRLLRLLGILRGGGLGACAHLVHQRDQFHGQRDSNGGVLFHPDFGERL